MSKKLWCTALTVINIDFRSSEIPPLLKNGTIKLMCWKFACRLNIICLILFYTFLFLTQWIKIKSVTLTFCSWLLLISKNKQSKYFHFCEEYQLSFQTFEPIFSLKPYIIIAKMWLLSCTSWHFFSISLHSLKSQEKNNFLIQL